MFPKLKCFSQKDKFQFLTGFALIFLHICSTHGADMEESEDDGQETENSAPQETFSSLILLPPGYNRLEIPKNKTARQFSVWVSLFIRNIPEIDEQNGELVLEADFGLLWRDYKLKEYYRKLNWTNPRTGEIIGTRTLDARVLEEIWNPDIFIDEQQSVKRTSVLKKQTLLKFISGQVGSDTGIIVYRARMKFRLQCEMDFTFYPADTQSCKFHIRSYTYPSNVLYIEWDTLPFLQEPNDPNFDLQVADAGPLPAENKLIYIEETFENRRRGNYTTLEFVVKLRRRLSYHLVQTYLPSVLLILITWICFLIPGDMVEARIGICMTTVLSLTAMFASVRGQSPRVSYTMGIDIWMVFNIFLVFLALLLFTTLYWMKMRLSEKAKVVAKTDLEDIQDDPVPTLATYRFVAVFARRYAFWFFAVTFFIFLLCYWSWLMYYSEYFDWDPSSTLNAGVDGAENKLGYYRVREYSW